MAENLLFVINDNGVGKTCYGSWYTIFSKDAQRIATPESLDTRSFGVELYGRLNRSQDTLANAICIKLILCRYPNPLPSPGSAHSYILPIRVTYSLFACRIFIQSAKFTRSIFLAYLYSRPFHVDFRAASQKRFQIFHRFRINPTYDYPNSIDPEFCWGNLLV